MKKFMILIALISFNAFGQSRSTGNGWTNGISFGVYQDGKLAIGADKEHGNDKPTLDMTFTVTLEGKQFSSYYFSMQPFYEHANLDSGYLRRYGVNALWNFNRLVIPKLEINLGGGLGMLHRDGEGFASYQFIGEIRYPIFNKLKVGLRNEFVRREFKELRYNLSLGLIFKN